MSDVRPDGSDERGIAKDRQVEVRALSGRLWDPARAHRRYGQRGERDGPEDDRRAAPPIRLEQESRGEERERAAEVERGDIEPDRRPAARGIGALRDDPDPGHVNAGETEPRDDPQQ